MKLRRIIGIIMLLALVLTAAGAKAQIVTTSPELLQIGSKDVTIFFHADQGNRGLADMPASAAIYAHTGVILEGSTQWSHAPSKWGDNAPKYKLEYVSPNIWKLNIGDIRTYYGLSATEKVARLAFVFRNADCSKEGKTATGGDIFVDVLAAGLQVDLTFSHQSPVLTSDNGLVEFTATSTQAADMAITIGAERIGSATNTTSFTASYTFTKAGSYTATLTANAGSQTASKSVDVRVLDPAQQQDYPGGKPMQGAVRQADGRVIFCIAAPQKSSASLVGSWMDFDETEALQMAYQDYENQRYFWTTVSGLKSDIPYSYYYLVDNSLRVGDPYARLILDPYYDQYLTLPDELTYPAKVSNVPLAVLWDSLADYEWKATGFRRPEASQLVIYELLLRDFTGTEGEAKGNGTAALAIDRIPYLKKLGVNAVELMPINEFNGNISWGYNPNFYFAPDKAYGLPADYKRLIDAFHEAGIAVILDVVFNQSDWLHPWYQLYQPGSNPFYNADAPHAYSVLNDWNQGHPLVQKQWEDMLTYWLTEYHVDGFRFDLVKGLGDNDSYSDVSSAATDAYNGSRVRRMLALSKLVDAVSPGAYCINEDLAGAKEENEMAEGGMLNWANINTEGMQFAAGNQSGSGLRRFYAPFDGSRLKGSTVSYLESHDEQRLAYVQDTDGVAGVKGNAANSLRRLGAAAAQMLMVPGAHMIWQFSELGDAQSTKNASGNETGPKKVVWNYLDDPERMGLYTSYSELIAIRTAHPEMFGPDVTPASNTAANFWTNGRSIVLTKGDKQIITAVNPNPATDITMTVIFSSKNNSDYKILSKSYATEPGFDAANSQITIPANGYVVIGSASLASSGFVKTDAPFKAFAISGGIELSGEIPAGNVFTADGRMAASFRAASGTLSLNLAPGLYIIRAGRHTAKVIVR